jgi:nucleoside-diphosphate-sugar epimerase
MGDVKMATGSGLVYGPQGQTPASLLALAGYLELSLEEGKCVVMMRHDTEVCSVYIGNVTGEDDELTGHGAIAAAVADEILELTQAGVNRITVGEETYRFVRSFTHIGDVGAVVFAPA